jgi:hypothetical protein
MQRDFGRADSFGIGTPFVLARHYLLGGRLMSDSDANHQTPQDEATPAGLPDWFNVYAGLSPKEIEELEEIILTRAVFARNGFLDDDDLVDQSDP